MSFIIAAVQARADRAAGLASGSLARGLGRAWSSAPYW